MIFRQTSVECLNKQMKGQCHETLNSILATMCTLHASNKDANHDQQQLHFDTLRDCDLQSELAHKYMIFYFKNYIVLNRYYNELLQVKYLTDLLALSFKTMGYDFMYK